MTPSERSFTAPHLEIVPLEQLRVHELYDDQRTLPLQWRIAESGVFRHPPIVAPLDQERIPEEQTYLVLDGANRVAALRALGIRDILVQIVPLNDPAVRLRTWNHLVLDFPADRLLECLASVPGLTITSSLSEEVPLPPAGEISLALLQTPQEAVYAIGAAARSPEGRIVALNRLVNCYQKLAAIERTTLNEIHHALPLYPNLGALILFPKFELCELVRLARQGVLLPPGITRITVSPRALYVNLPLAELQSPLPLAEKNANLQALLVERLARGKIVHIAEASYVFDD